MTLTNAIAILKRQDAKAKVDVPASGNRKAYSYYRERSGKGGAIAVGIGGAIAGGALTAALLSRKKAKNGDDVIDVESREMSNAIAGSRMKSALPQGRSRTSRSGRALVTPPPINSSSRVLVTPAAKKSISQMVKEGVGTPSTSKQNATLSKPKSLSQMVKEGVGTSSTSKQNAQLFSDKSENLLTKGIKSRLKAKNVEAKTSEQQGSQPKNQSAYPPKRQGIIDKGIAAVRNMVKEGGDRHNKAVKNLAEKEIDLNKVAYTVGAKSQIAANNMMTFSKAYAETFGLKKPKAIEVKATEVKESSGSLTLSKQSQSKKKSKRKAPTAAKKRSTQKQLDDLNS